METVAGDALVGSAANLAVTTTVGGLGTVAGAVYFPVASIAPQLAPVQPVPETVQVTAWLAPLGVTVEVNCCTRPTGTVALEGVTMTSAEGGSWLLTVEAGLPPHPTRNSIIPAPTRRLAVNPPAEIEARRRFIGSSFFHTDNLVMPTLLGEDGANQCLAAGFWLVSFWSGRWLEKIGL